MWVKIGFNMLACCGCAMLAGVLLSIGLSFGTYWKSLPPAEFLDWFRLNGIRIVPRPIPFVMIPAAVGIIGSFWLDRQVPAARLLWLGSAVSLVGVLVVTGAYFVSANTAFATKSIAVPDVAAALRTWLAVHWVRIALATGSAIFAFLASRR